MFYTTVSSEASLHFCFVGFSKRMYFVYFAAEIQYKNVMTHLRVALQNEWFMVGVERQRQNCCSKGFICNRTFEKQERKQECKKTKNMRYSCHLQYYSIRKYKIYKQKKPQKNLTFFFSSNLPGLLRLVTCSHPHHI